MNNEKHWGYHLLLDMGGCNDRINNESVVTRFVMDLVKKIKMKPIGAPMVVYVDDEEGKGVSAVQLITTSTITFHGDAEGNRLFLDVFSCKHYDSIEVIEFTQEWFKPKTTKATFHYRDA